MTITVRNASELRAALNSLVEAKVDRAVSAATREVAVYAFTQWTSGKFTWSRYQPNAVWSGQSRASVNVSVGTPDRSYAPGNPGDWPIHASPYGPRDPFEARFKLEGLVPYQPVYVSDSAPHAAKVEAHTQVMHQAAEFSRAHFKPGYAWAPVVTASASVPF